MANHQKQRSPLVAAVLMMRLTMMRVFRRCCRILRPQGTMLRETPRCAHPGKIPPSEPKTTQRIGGQTARHQVKPNHIDDVRVPDALDHDADSQEELPDLKAPGHDAVRPPWQLVPPLNALRRTQIFFECARSTKRSSSA
jgi:hypothetical protein